MDSFQDGDANAGLPVLVFDCTGQKGNQYWYYRSDGQLGRDLQCVVARPEHSQEQNAVALGSCGQEPGWDYDPRLALLQHRLSGLCLRVTRYSCCCRDSEVMTTSLLCRTPLQLWLVECNKADTQQKWFFTNFEENGIPDIGESEDDEEGEEGVGRDEL